MQNFTLRDKEKRTIIEVEGRKQGAEWVAICAKHDDHNPSLYINEEKRVYLCRVCDWRGDLYNADYRDNNQDSKTGKKILATYDYSDELNKLLYQVVRYYPKTFTQRQPDGEGGWTWNLNGVGRILCRLPEVIGASDPVFIVEGEKD